PARWVPRAELDTADAEERRRVEEVLGGLRAARILVESAGLDGEPGISLADGALLLRWNRLREWAAAENETRSWERRLGTAAADWERSGRLAGFLWDQD